MVNYTLLHRWAYYFLVVNILIVSTHFYEAYTDDRLTRDYVILESSIESNGAESLRAVGSESSSSSSERSSLQIQSSTSRGRTEAPRVKSETRPVTNGTGGASSNGGQNYQLNSSQGIITFKEEIKIPQRVDKNEVKQNLVNKAWKMCMNEFEFKNCKDFLLTVEYESSWDINMKAKNGDGGIGLCQWTPPWWTDFIKSKDFYNEDVQLKACYEYYFSQKKKYGYPVGLYGYAHRYDRFTNFIF